MASPGVLTPERAEQVSRKGFDILRLAVEMAVIPAPAMHPSTRTPRGLSSVSQVPGADWRGPHSGLSARHVMTSPCNPFSSGIQRGGRRLLGRGFRSFRLKLRHGAPGRTTQVQRTPSCMTATTPRCWSVWVNVREALGCEVLERVRSGIFGSFSKMRCDRNPRARTEHLERKPSNCTESLLVRVHPLTSAL